MHLYYSGLKILLVLVVFTLSAFSAADNGLVGEWLFENRVISFSGQTVADTSGNGLSGTSGGAATGNTSGRFGNALDYQGSTGQVDIAHNGLLKPPTEITIEAWVNPWFNNETRQIWRKEDGTDRSLFSFQTGSACDNFNNGSSCIAFGIGIGGTYSEIEAVADGMNNGWHYVLGTFNGTNRSIWIDGSMKNSSLASGAIGTTGSTSARIGNYGTNLEVFKGSIDEVRFYNRSLNPTEIVSHYNCNYVAGTMNWQIANKSVWCRAIVNVTGNLTILDNATFNQTWGVLNTTQDIIISGNATVYTGQVNISVQNLNISGSQANFTAPTSRNNMNVSGAATISGRLYTADGNVTVNGATTINSGGILGNSTNWTFNQNGALTINSGATFNAPNASGTWTYGNAITSNGIMNPDGGEAKTNSAAGLHIRISGSNVTFNNISTGVTGFVTVVADSTGGGITNVLIMGNLTTSGGTRLTEGSGAASVSNITFGTATSSGRIIWGDTTLAILPGSGTSILQAANSAYPWQWQARDSGGDITPTFNVGTVNFTNGNITPTITTGGAGTNFNVVNTTFNGTVTVSSGDNWVYGGMITHLAAMTSNSGSTLNSSFANMTIIGTFNISSTRSTMNDSTINAFGPFYISGSGNVTFTNVTMTNATPTVYDTANFTVRWRNIQVTDENGTVVSGAITNVTQGGSVIASGTTDSSGFLPTIISDYQNIGGTVTLFGATIAGSKSGYSTNSITDNVTRSNYLLVLGTGVAQSGYSTGFAIDGNPYSTTFTPVVRVNNLAVRGPWQNLQNVTIIDNATGIVIANFSHNFSSLSFPARYLRIDYGSSWVGIGTRGVTALGHLNYSYTLNVPVFNSICNTQACSGENKLVLANCDASDWATYPSVKSGNVCLASVRGTVVRDQPDISAIVAVPELDLFWVVLIFTISFAIFAGARYGT